MTEQIKISKKITGFSIAANDASQEAVAEVPKDVNPITSKIDKREAGRLNAINEKVVYYTSEGKKSVYLSVSFMKVDGVLDGEPISINRPVEFFYIQSDQWITAAMRNLSFAARSGFLAEALQDMRDVEWTKGPVTCGKKDYGNGKAVGIKHNSEVAALAWAIQSILAEAGFLDPDGNQIPINVLARKGKVSLDDALPVVDYIEADAKPAVETETKKTGQGQNCKDCGSEGTVQMMDGCLTCTACGSSKCG